MIQYNNTRPVVSKSCNLFEVLGPRCWTGSSMLDYHVLKGFGIYMIGILGRLY